MIEHLFHPKSIAIIGASRHRNKVGNIVLRNLIATFHGKIFPVNKHESVIEGLKAYRSVKDINEGIDLAIISIPRDFVVDALEEAGEVGIKAAIILTSGFRELDEIGAKLEEELKAIARRYNIRFLGPNTFGLITPDFNATFSPFDVKRGKIAILSQSGGLGFYVLDWLQRNGSGVSYFVSLGNQADVNEVDTLEYIARDPRNKAVFVYLEGVSEGRRLLNVLSDITTKVPVIFLKGGISKSGSRAAMTHTGSVAGSYEVFKAAINSAGGIVVENLEDFLELMKLYSFEEPIKDKILIITNSGGHGVLTSDAVEKYGLSLCTLDEETKKKLKELLPPYLKPNNPLDLSVEAPSTIYDKALEATKDIDCTKIVIGEYSPVTSCVEDAKVLIKYKGKSVIGVFMGSDEREAISILTENGMPAFNYPEVAVRVISHLFNKINVFKKPKILEPPVLVKELIKGKDYLKDYEAFKLLEIYGIKTPRYRIVENIEELRNAVEELNFPIVLKISSDRPIHKTDIGGVILNINSVEDAINAYNKLSRISPRILVQEQLSGYEIFVGGFIDNSFGPAIVVGLGGILVEILNKVAYAVAPISYDEAEYLLKETKIYDALKARNRNYDINSVEDALVKAAKMMSEINIKEMDINPLIVNENGSYAVDVRILLANN